MITILPKRSDEWSNSYLTNNLKQHLATLESSKSKIETDLLKDESEKFDFYFSLISKRHYVIHAFHYLRVAAFKPVPEFLVSISDLAPRLINELALLDRAERYFVLRQAVGRIFEYVNLHLFHRNISKVLRVRLVE